MKKDTQSPGAVIESFIEKHGLNCNRLAHAIGMSNAMVRLMVQDQSPISLAAAFRLAKFFKNKPEYWLHLQLKFDLAQGENDKKLAKEIEGITDVGNYTFTRKPHAPRKGKRTTTKKKPTLADRRKKAGKVPGAKPARRQRRK